MKQRNPKEEKSSNRGRQPERGTRGGHSDYWDRIARDVADGYGAQRGSDRTILNPDQRADDARRGDA